MDEEHLRPLKEDLNAALQVEQELLDSEVAFYMECLDNRPMSVRIGARDQRDGCILTAGVFWKCAGKDMEDYPSRRKILSKKKGNKYGSKNT